MGLDHDGEGVAGEGRAAMLCATRRAHEPYLYTYIHNSHTYTGARIHSRKGGGRRDGGNGGG